MELFVVKSLVSSVVLAQVRAGRIGEDAREPSLEEVAESKRAIRAFFEKNVGTVV